MKFLFVAVFTAATVLIGQAVGPTPASKFFNASELLNDIKTLSADEMEGRSADRPSMQLARDFVERRFRESGLQPFGASFAQEFDIKLRGSQGPVRGVNFLGWIRGGQHAGKYIVISAHYDHVGVMRGAVYNGADDNASGTAALFALAGYFKKHRPQHSLIFAAFDAEEKGLQGSRHFLANSPVPRPAILLNVNMDMLSRSDKGELYAAGTYHYPQFVPVLKTIQRSAKVKLLLGHDDPKLGRNDWTFQSDHGAFHREKIPFIYFGVEDHKDYHRSTDDFENIMPEFYVRAVETVLTAVEKLDKELARQ